MPDEPPRDPATIAAHGVRAPAPEAGRPAAEPIYQTSVFDFPTVDASEGPLALRGDYVYGRYGLPNARSLELTLAALEGTEDALATSSGMSAVAAAALALARAGDRVLYQADAYGGTAALFRHDLPRMGVTAVAVDGYDLGAVARELDAEARALFVETLSNPLLREVDIPGLARLCRERGAALVVDNTFATPVLRRPVESGATLVLHSATKFLGGHHDLLAGVLCGPRDLVAEARGVARRLGMTAAPFDAWLASRGIRTLAVRVDRAQENARDLAARLRRHPRVAAVHHPGWGAMLSFDLGDEPAARRVVAALRLVTLTPSLGGTGTTVSHAASSSHRNLAPEERERLGIGPGLLRLSVGVDAVRDVWRDLEGALRA